MAQLISAKNHIKNHAIEPPMVLRTLTSHVISFVVVVTLGFVIDICFRFSRFLSGKGRYFAFLNLVNERRNCETVLFPQCQTVAVRKPVIKID